MNKEERRSDTGKYLHGIQTGICRKLNMTTQICVIIDLEYTLPLIRRQAII